MKGRESSYDPVKGYVLSGNPHLHNDSEDNEGDNPINDDKHK
jgi:hypothetical protein